MNEFVKIGLTALGVILTTILGFFVTTVTEEFRSNPTLAYAIDKRSDGTTISLENVSRVTVADARILMSCPDRPCFNEKGTPPKLFQTVGVGNITAQIIPDKPNASLITVNVTIAPGAEVRLRIYPTDEDREALLVLFEPEHSGNRSIQLLEAGSLTGLIIRYFVPILSTLFLVVLASVIVIPAIMLISFARSKRCGAPYRKPEIGHETIHVVVSFDDSHGRGDTG